MRLNRLFRLLSLFAALMLVFPAALPSAAQEQKAPAMQPSAPTKIIVDARDAATLRELKSGGALLADYGSFSLWRVSQDRAQALASRESVTARDDFDAIFTRSGAFYPLEKADSAVPDDLRQAKTDGNRFGIVQFVGPVKDAWLDELRSLGLELVIYMPNNAYVVWGDDHTLTKLAAQVTDESPVQWAGAYQPAYRLAPELQKTARSAAGADLVDVTVQFYTTKGLAASLAKLQGLGGKVYKPQSEVLGFTDISLQVPAGKLTEIANWSDVFNVEPWAAPRRLDEVQGQILAGNVANSGGNIVPTAPGYLAWLASKAFPTTPANYPIVDIVDDGIDQGNASNVLHPDFHELGNILNPDRIVYLNNCTTDALPDGLAGHGNLNAGIVGAYNNLTGSPHQDANGYRIGLGMSPYNRLAGTKIFDNAGSYDAVNCGDTDQGVVAASYAGGAAITSNSWGAPVGGAYDSSSQAYDALTRDASSTTAGNQPMLHVFSAGNSGPGGNTIGSPGTAKNVITVGGTENVRDEGVADGCAVTASNNADDMISFASRGPTDDGRVKPDIVGPAAHVQGPASQDPGFDGTGVCGGSSSIYYPSGQTLYTWSSGTSHSAPAIAGASALIYEYYGRVLKPGFTPSPAMVKALMVNAPRYLTGSGANDTLPSNNQGWGDANLGMVFDGAARYLLDQATVFGNTGDTLTKIMAVADSSKPVHVSLVWTDAPGSTSGNAYVNNLDLEVTIGGQTYKGNVFSGANSATGGTADPRNNLENVFLPAGQSGNFVVTVKASNIAGDGVPGNADTTDQDFALVVYNGNESSGPVLVYNSSAINDAAGNGNGAAEPGENGILLNVALGNTGTAAATGISAVLSTSTPGVIVTQPNSAYPDIAAAGTGTNNTPFAFNVLGAVPCGTVIDFTLTVTTAQGVSVITFSVPTGLVTNTTFTSTDVPKAIPDSNPAGVVSTLNVPTSMTISDVNATVNINHTWDGDLILSLISPSGTTVTLANRRGSSGDNFINTVFDDEAAVPISGGSAPFTGSFRPETPLSAVDGQAASGTWQFKAVDAAAGDTGTITGWNIAVTSVSCTVPVPHVVYSSHAFSDVAGGNGDGIVDPGETIQLNVTLGNTGTAAATGVSAVLSTSTPNVTITSANSAYPNIAAGGTAVNTTPFVFDVGNVPCGTIIPFVVTVHTAQGDFVVNLTVTVGSQVAATFTSTDVPKAIPDSNPAGVVSTLIVPTAATVADVNATVNINHTWDGDLILSLISPAGTPVTLANHRGGSGDNFVNTVFDDEAAVPISDGSAPFTGSFRPEAPLSAVDGQAANGTWQFKVVDAAAGDTGTITAWSIALTTAQCHPFPHLSVSKQGVILDPPVNSLAEYSIVVANTGALAGDNLTLTDNLPAGGTYSNAQVTSGPVTLATRYYPAQWAKPAQTGGSLERKHAASKAPSVPAQQRAPIEAPAVPAAPDSCTQVIQDGSFEAGSPSPAWTEASTNFGTPLCTVATCGSGGGTALPRTGTWWVWFGGYSAGTEIGSVSQSVTLQAGTATLTFYLWNGASGGASDAFKVRIDGADVFSTLAGDPTYTGGYTLVTVDLTAFADGGSHTVEFYAATYGGTVTNFSLDDIALESCSGAGGCASMPSGPLTNIPAAGGNWVITDDPLFGGSVDIPVSCKLVVTYKFAPAGPGTYVNTATLRSSTNDVLGTATFTLVIAHPPQVLGWVFIDENGDGIRQPTETKGLAGVWVSLEQGGSTVGQVTSIPTDGWYQFTNVPPGNYCVKAPIPNGYVATSPTFVCVTVTTGDKVVNFGVQQANASIGDYVWYDSNADGVQDGTEFGLGGVTLALWSEKDGHPNVVLATTTTDVDGKYLFTKLMPGMYFVQVTDTGGVLAGMSLTIGPQSKPNPFGPITVAQNQAYIDADFGYALFPDANHAVISDAVWHDTNGNGTWDVGEPGIGGVQVCAEPMAHTATYCAVSNAHGIYGILVPAPATYLVAPLNPPAGLTLTTPGFYLPVVVMPGQRIVTDDFGYR